MSVPSQPSSEPAAGIARAMRRHRVHHMLDIELRAGRGKATLVLSGELDSFGVAALDDAVDIVHRSQVAFGLDCRQLTFVDSAGVSALRRAIRRGGTVDGAHGTVLRMFEILGLADELTASAAARAAWTFDTAC